MADRKSSDNELLTELAADDLFDVLDDNEGVSSNKNKSIRKADLFTQIANELGLTGDSGRQTAWNALNGWAKGASSYYRKVGKTVFLNIQMNPNSASAITCMTMPVGYRPTRIVACSVSYLSALANAQVVAYINPLTGSNPGEVRVVKEGTPSTVPTGSVAYQITATFDVD